MLALLLRSSPQKRTQDPRFSTHVASCGKRVAGGWLSFRCSVCEQWCHKRCSGIRSEPEFRMLAPWSCLSLQRPGPTIDPVPQPGVVGYGEYQIVGFFLVWYLPRLVPSFRRLRGPGRVGSQVRPRVHEARITLVTVLQVLTSGEETSCSSTATAYVTATQNCRTSLHRNHVQVACLQETKLVPGSALEEFSGYTTVRRDRTTGGGGVMCLVSHSCTFSVWDTTDIINA